MGNPLVTHGNLSATEDISWYLYSHLLPDDKPNFAFFYLDVYFVQAHNFRSEEGQFLSIQTTNSSRLPQDHLNIHWIAWKIGRLESVLDFGDSKHNRWRMCCSTSPPVILLRVVHQQPWFCRQQTASSSLGLADSYKEKCFLQQCRETS